MESKSSNITVSVKLEPLDEEEMSMITRSGRRCSFIEPKRRVKIKQEAVDDYFDHPGRMEVELPKDPVEEVEPYMVTRSGRRCSLGEPIRRVVKEELVDDYVSVICTVGTELSDATLPIQTEPLEVGEMPIITRSGTRLSNNYVPKLRIKIKKEPVDEQHEDAIPVPAASEEATEDVQEVQFVAPLPPRRMSKRRKSSPRVEPLEPRRKGSIDLFPMDDAARKYFPCPVPYCEVISKNRASRHFHLRSVHPFYKYKEGDGWEKIRENSTLLRQKIHGMTEILAALSSSRPTSPDTPPHNTPSPPAAVVPTGDPTLSSESKPVISTAQRRNEEVAFANFLALEEQRLKKSNPQLPTMEREKKITMKWMSMRPAQRLRYLLEDGGKKEVITVEEEKKKLKRKLDEELDSRLKQALSKIVVPKATPLVPPTVASSQKKSSSRKSSTAGTTLKPSLDSIKFEDLADGFEGDYSQEQIEKKPKRKRRPSRKRSMEIVLDVENMPPVPLEVHLATNRQMSYFQSMASHLPPAPRVSPSTAREALDLYYLALCEPAFPQADEHPLTEHNANHYWEAYQRLTRL